MHHDTPLITMVAVGLVLAFAFGAVANRLRIPPLVGYLLAGIVVGPYTPGFIADADLAAQLSEIGVILLMFGVGLHFSFKDLLSVRAIAIPGAFVQMAGATALGVGLALLMGWSLLASFIFGLSLSVASTVVLLKALQDRHLIESDRGRVAVGWLIVEDVAMVMALVAIPAIASFAGASSVEIYDPFVNFIERLTRTELGIGGVLAVTAVKLAAFVGFMLVVGRRIIPLMLHYTAHTGSRELFRLAVLAVALGVAVGAAYLFGVSLALGAFFAGMILSESELSHRAAEETLPLRDAFAVLFFVGVGMLFDPTILLRDPLPVLATLFIIIVGKSFFAFIIVMMFRRSVGTALTISASLAQIGEFSFILAGLGVSLAVLPEEGRDLIMAGAILSILINPLVFWATDLLRPALEARYRTLGPDPVARTEPELSGGPAAAAGAAAPAEETLDAAHATALSAHTILVGYGRVGTVVAEGLLANAQAFVLIEDAELRIAAARQAGIEVIAGNAASSEVLALANVAEARAMVIAIPNAFEAGQATEQGRKANPGMTIIARAHSDEEEAHLLHLGADKVLMGEREIGLGLLQWLGADTLAPVAAEVAAPPSPEPPPEPEPEPAAPPVPIVSLEPEFAEGVPLPEEFEEPEAVSEPPAPVPEPPRDWRPSRRPGVPFETAGTAATAVPPAPPPAEPDDAEPEVLPEAPEVAPEPKP